MKYSFKLLIAERNRHIRTFIQREFVAEGFEVFPAKDSIEIYKLLQEKDYHLLILDEEIIKVGVFPVLDYIYKVKPSLPIILYVFQGQTQDEKDIPQIKARIEKSGNPNRLKTCVIKVLFECYPLQFQEKGNLNIYEQ
ncbi:MAG: hypothetical protein HQK76_05630 [Desulfobacterales bacterium]|nr:hypothetical protein [Desulfobacterales bacterium]